MYKINVARNGHHLFEAECRGASEAQAVAIWEDMCSRYVGSEYLITLMCWETVGRAVQTKLALQAPAPAPAPPPKTAG